MVHMNIKYSSVAEAKNNTDGLAVLGVFVDVSGNVYHLFYPSDNTSIYPSPSINGNPSLNNIVDNIVHAGQHNVVHAGQFNFVRVLAMSTLFTLASSTY